MRVARDGIDLGEAGPLRPAVGLGVQQPDAVGQAEGQRWARPACRATMMSSSGFIRTVSFQPSSLASGGLIVPSQPTRLITCTLNRWKWIGMGIDAVVGDLPDLGFARGDDLGREDRCRPGGSSSGC